MERLKDLLLSLMVEPVMLRFLGTTLMVLSLFAIMLGARSLVVERQLALVSSQIQAIANGRAPLPTPPGGFAQWPILQAFLPETAIGFIAWLCILLTGVQLISFSKDLKRMY
ncbi:hypothetical protein ACRS1R_04885 [Aeromonas dhakensis]|uniref:hypothetical protein n=1 Tax=Aeromonas dhakensis TaxID=196024 RepID=UPI003EDF8643